jgi:hypothetical protein
MPICRLRAEPTTAATRKTRGPERHVTSCSLRNGATPPIAGVPTEGLPGASQIG